MLFTRSLLMTLWIAFGIYSLFVALMTKGEPTKDTTRLGKLVYWHGVAFIGLLIILAAWTMLQIVASNIQADLLKM